MNQVDSLIMDPDTIDSPTHDAVDDLMDLRSLADYWWLQEFSCNNDAFVTDSTYLHKDRNGKLCWGPLWDFDLVFFKPDKNGMGTANGFNNTKFSWTDKLRDQDPQFVQLLRSRWEEPSTGLNAQLEEITRPGGVLDQYKEGIASSWEASYAKWGNQDPVESGQIDFDEAVERVRTWIDTRRAWVNQHLDELGRVYVTITYMADGKAVHEDRYRDTVRLLDGPEAPKLDGFVFVGWTEQETGAEHYGYRTNVDTVFVANYLSESEATAPTALYFSRYEDWVDVQMDTYDLCQWKLAPEDATVGPITWTSSNEDVAVPARNGIVELKSTGDATITATLYNVVSSSYVLHVYDWDEQEPVGPADVSVNPLTLMEGQTAQIKATLSNDNQPLRQTEWTFEAEDPSVVEVIDSEMGIVKGLKPGKTTVTLKVEIPYDDFEPIYATCEVTVEGEEPQQPERHTITYQLNGGTYNGSTQDIVETHEEGTTIRIHEAPTREGYRFLYWKGSKYQPGDTYVVSEDHTLVAQWEKVSTTPGSQESTAKAQPLAKTGDMSAPAAWQALALAGLLALAGGALLRLHAGRK